MPRRALRKIDPALDLASFWRTFDELPRPWDSTVLFGRSAPLEVEVGSGKGLFIASAAAANRGHNYLGIEIALKYSRFAAARLAKAGLRNAMMVNADAQRVFGELLPDMSLAAVHVYFPDPWWKARHKKRRVLNERFVKHVERTLLPGGSLHFWTDVEEYFQTALALIAMQTALTGPIEVPPAEPAHELDYRTHFERRVRLVGESVYRAEFRKAP
jgi:tRNA (guanine-N7-)-methyltransferase